MGKQYLGRLLSLTAKLLREQFDASLAEVGGSLSAWVVLRAAHGSGGLSQRELAALLGIEAPTLVRHLDRLEAEGLIERRRDGQDRRVIRVTITPTGKRLLDRMTVVADRHEAELRGALTTEEHRTLTTALEKLHQLATDRRNADGRRRRVDWPAGHGTGRHRRGGHLDRGPDEGLPRHGSARRRPPDHGGAPR